MWQANARFLLDAGFTRSRLPNGCLSSLVGAEAVGCACHRESIGGGGKWEISSIWVRMRATRRSSSVGEDVTFPCSGVVGLLLSGPWVSALSDSRLLGAADRELPTGSADEGREPLLPRSRFCGGVDTVTAALLPARAGLEGARRFGGATLWALLPARLPFLAGALDVLASTFEDFGGTETGSGTASTLVGRVRFNLPAAVTTAPGRRLVGSCG